jgi:L-aminoadipate-semialdehyde dehydrogenase
MPLYHFVTADLPSSTKAPELDDSNAAAALKADVEWSGEDVSAGSGVTEEMMGVYLSYLVAVGFVPPPPSQESKALPAVKISESQKKALLNVGGRGGLV